MATRIDVISHASEVKSVGVEGRTVVVVDTLRATSTIAALLAGGVVAVYPAGTVDEARALRDTLGPVALLCGERGGLPPVGFDSGNSPVEIDRMSLAGRTAVLTTSNGTLALRRAWESRAGYDAPILTAALVNARAAIAAALRHGGDIAILCAGEQSGSVAAEEDLYTAGYLAHAAVQQGAVLSIEAANAKAMVDREPNAATALRSFRHAQDLVNLGLGPDIEWCARANVLDIVPVLRPDGAGVPRLEAVPSDEHGFPS